ncbi:hypothetical protein K3495_g3765 [Podosphaera aphanis]|nr:hypothetical protein K3495_g3765 [Podosphaera aphanis]
MAVVLNSEDNRFFTSSQLRRSHSQPKFLTSQTSYTNSSFRPKRSSSFRTLIDLPASLPSSGAASPRSISSGILSYSPSSLGEISLDGPCETTDDEENHQINFPSYDDFDYYGNSEELDSPVSPRNEDSYTVSSAELPTTPSAPISSSVYVPRPPSINLVEHAEDDTAIRVQPSRHVDYLSHNWREEDIWSSWKFVISRRKSYNNSARLENASWRTWIKAKNKLKTVSPDKLNWLKDCDVTWLYGPLQTGPNQSNDPSTSPASGSRPSKTNSFLCKKPILKKRSMSEIMLQKSLSSSSLLKQAAAAVQAQQSNKRGECSQSTSFPSTYLYTFPTRQSSRINPSYMSTVSSTNLTSPSNGEKKRIHFNEQVEQCIALEVKGEEDDEPYPPPNYDDSDSDDVGIMMKRSTSKRKFPPLMARKKTRSNPTQDSKTIAMLPSTTLKYRPSTPDTPPRLSKKYSSEIWNGTSLSPSPSFETLRPSKSSSRMLLGDDDGDDDMDWYPPSNFSTCEDETIVAEERLSDSSSSTSSLNTNGSGSLGLKRNTSTIFIPSEGSGNDFTSDGIFGKVVETVNTAKDIAHVIWNVGWMR